MKALLIHPYATAPPFGLMSIKSHCQKQGIKIDIWDNTDEKLSSQKVNQKIKGYDIIGVSIYSMPMIKQAITVIKAVKKSKALLVLGGVHATLFPKQCIKEFGCDVVVVGEGEKAFCEILKRQGKDLESIPGLYLNKAEIVYTGPSSIDPELVNYEVSVWDSVNIDNYITKNLVTGRKSLTLVQSRGCPYKCRFCYVSEMFGHKWRGKSAWSVAEEIRHLKSKYGVRHIDFFDDLPFGGSKQGMLQFCEELRGLGVTWTCDYRVNLVDAGLLKVMKEAGCKYIYFGVESGSPRILKFINKSITVEQVVKAFELCDNAGIMSMAGFMTGFPTETLEDLRLTVALAERIKATRFRLAKYVPYPGGELYAVALSHGFVPPENSEAWGELGSYVKRGLNLSRIPENSIVWRKHYLEKFLSVKNTLGFSLRHWDFTYLPYFLLDTLPEGVVSVLVKGYRGVQKWCMMKARSRIS